jgi:hypothetical protein
MVGEQQAAGFDYRAGTKRSGSLDGVLKFPHVAGPVIADKPVGRFRTDAKTAMSAFFAIAFAEEIHKQRDIFPPFP